jgi:GTPase SAR1 family protein
MGAAFSWLGVFLERIGMKSKACNIVLLGLDNAGKTTLLNLLLTGKFQRFERTMRARQQVVSVGPVKFNAWDLGGHEAARSSWSDFYLQCGGVVYMVDAADHSRSPPVCAAAAAADRRCRLQEALDEFQGVFRSCRCVPGARTIAAAAQFILKNPLFLHPRRAPFHSRRSEQALPVIVLINKMDRKDAAPFPDLEVPAPAPALHAARRVQRSLTPPNRKCSMTPPALLSSRPEMLEETHRSPAVPSRATCAAFRPASRSRRGTRWLPVPPHACAVLLMPCTQEALLWLAERIPSS